MKRTTTTNEETRSAVTRSASLATAEKQTPQRSSLSIVAFAHAPRDLAVMANWATELYAVVMTASEDVSRSGLQSAAMFIHATITC